MSSLPPSIPPDQAEWLKTALEMYRALPLRASKKALDLGESILRGVLAADHCSTTEWDRREGVEVAVMGAIAILSNVTTGFDLRVWAESRRESKRFNDLWALNMAQLTHWAKDISGWPAVNVPMIESLDSPTAFLSRRLILLVVVDADGLSVSL